MLGRRIKAISFDIGGTLTYSDAPLSWLSLYRKALSAMAEHCGCNPSDRLLSAAECHLARYNTRLNPRIVEVTSDEILTPILLEWQLDPDKCLQEATNAFFAVFLANPGIYDDVSPTLNRLRSMGLRIGALTDTAYGMPRRLVDADVAQIAHQIDVLLTSVEVGMRKPDPTGYLQLASALQISPHEMAYVGNEPKDVAGAMAAGVLSVLIDRDGSADNCGEDFKLQSLTELFDIIDQPR